MSNPRAETLLAALLAIVEVSNHAEDCEGENECNMLTIAEKAIAADGVMSHQARAIPAATAGEALRIAEDALTAIWTQNMGSNELQYIARVQSIAGPALVALKAALRPAAAAQQS